MPEYALGWKDYVFEDDECASIEEIAAFLAKVHSTPTDWYDPIREEFCRRWPILREFPRGSHVWWYVNRPNMFENLPDHKMREWVKFCP